MRMKNKWMKLAFLIGNEIEIKKIELEGDK